MRILFGLLLSLIVALVPAPADSGGMMLLGAGKPAAGASYQGPGDIVSGALIWGSCARVYNASLASTATSLCDLVDTTTGAVAICTLRGSSTGFVDLAGSYCTGSTTPAVACAAAAGGACRVSKVYDQIGGTSGYVQATNAQRPVLTFSVLNSLPCATGTGAANTNLTSSSTFTQTQWTWTSVAKRTSSAQAGVIGASGGFNGYLGFTAVADTAGLTSNNVTFVTLGSVTDSAFHALQGVMDPGGAGGTLAVDGVEASGAVGIATMSVNTSRVMRLAAGASLPGDWCEGGLWPSLFNGTQRTNMNSNIHGTSGYNF